MAYIVGATSPRAVTSRTHIVNQAAPRVFLAWKYLPRVAKLGTTAPMGRINVLGLLAGVFVPRSATNLGLTFSVKPSVGTGGGDTPKRTTGQLWPRGDSVRISKATTVNVTVKETLDGGTP